MEDTPLAEECQQPPALDDVALITWIDGEANQQTQEHLSACPACTRRAQELAELQILLYSKLHRASCPPSNTLAAFQQGMLEGGQSTLVAQHLAICPDCRRELRLLREIVAPAPCYSSKASAI